MADSDTSKDALASNDGASDDTSSVNITGTTDAADVDTSDNAASPDTEVQHGTQQQANSEVSDEYQQAGGPSDQQAVTSSHIGSEAVSACTTCRDFEAVSHTAPRYNAHTAISRTRDIMQDIMQDIRQDHRDKLEQSTDVDTPCYLLESSELSSDRQSAAIVIKVATYGHSDESSLASHSDLQTDAKYNDELSTPEITSKIASKTASKDISQEIRDASPKDSQQLLEHTATGEHNGHDDEKTSKPGWSPFTHSPVHDTDSLRDDSVSSVQDFTCQTSICEPLDDSQLSINQATDSDAQALATVSASGLQASCDNAPSTYTDIISVLKHIRASGEAPSLMGAISAVADNIQQQPQAQISVNITNNVSVNTSQYSENFINTLNEAIAEGPLTSERLEKILSEARDKAELTHKVTEKLSREQVRVGATQADLNAFAQKVQEVINENVKAGKTSKKNSIYAKNIVDDNRSVDLSHIINPHGPDNPLREALNAMQPPAEQFVCMAAEAADKIKKNIKVQLYESDMNPIEWWDTYNSFCDIHGYSVENKRDYLPFHLGKSGSKWFHRSGIAKVKLKVNPTDADDTIQFVREAFLEKFGVKEPDMYTYKRDLYDMVQGRDTCTEFTEKVIDAFRNLFKCPAGEPLTKDQFVDVRTVVTGGVKPRARDHILIKNPTNVDELLAAATTAGHMDKESKNDYAANIRQELMPEIQKVLEPINKEIKALKQETKIPKQSDAKKAKTDINDLMSSISEIKENMKQMKRTRSQTPTVVRGACFNCGMEGHIKRNCPSLPRSAQSQSQRYAPYYQQFGPVAHDGGGSGNIRQGQGFNANRPRRQLNRANEYQLQTCQWCQKQGHTVSKCYLMKEQIALLIGNGQNNADQNENLAQMNGVARGPNVNVAQ